ncbi:heterokaryon incompatibility protein-domain-containing protein [Thelonectria olida]|uniref:Heterokaryon incompatibility protein-domain-containing protein n=1 Tax=Thelonectria olida TaxID=1576542 RepID=A0A9P9AJZ1_9HYPO|nr:heterokaryon incompatibility protein-domain-containing protein [Thelonectria olida]
MAQPKRPLSLSALERGLIAGVIHKTYEALPQHDSIRLLTLHPGEGASRVQCSLSAVRLSDQPKYEALSYSSEDPRSLMKCILLDEEKYPVCDNLWWALLYLRHPSETRVLWVDGICINKNDIQERNCQVELTGMIVSQASCVVMWLGRATIGSRQSMGLFNDLASASDSSDEGVRRMISSRPGVEHKLRRLFHLRLCWTRPWILQEAVLAKDITMCCSGDQLTWDAFRTAVQRIISAMPYIKSSEGSTKGASFIQVSALTRAFDGTFGILLDAARSQCQSSTTQDVDLRSLIGISQWSSFSVPRDRIYGLLGMLETTMPVDYTKTPFDVYADAIQHLRYPSVRRSADLEHLYMVRFSRLLQKLLKGPISNLQATAPCLIVQGLLGGRILGLIDISETHDSKELRDKATLLIDRHSESMTQSQQAKVAQLLDNFSFDYGYGKGSHLSSAACKPHYFQATFDQRVDSLQVPNTVPKCGIVPVPKTSSDTSSQSSLFLSVTSEPLLGYAPPLAQAGDLLVRFLMSDSSIFIRASAHGHDFVGRAYVPRLRGASCDLSSETREIDHDPVDGDAITLENLHLYKEHVKIGLDAETLQFISNYWEFEGMSRS